MTNHCCLHVDLTLNVTPEAWLARCEAALPTMAELPGLLWKLWVLDPARSRAGGVYLFCDARSARAYAEGPVLAALEQSAAVANLSVQLLPLVDSLSRRTRGLPSAEAATELEHGR